MPRGARRPRPGGTAAPSAAYADPGRAGVRPLRFPVVSVHPDEAVSRGRGVRAVGPAQAVTAPDDLRHPAGHTRTAPWAGGEHDMRVPPRPVHLTGCRVTPADQ
ncbi:hypothetical protein A4U61_06000 [Streptomyces sp. H-KF8]|nr:hypothetical protein A4U61_06000 [Streptomyces sp. H-KF8]